MSPLRTENLLGALALAVADDVARATDACAPEGGNAAAALALVGHEPGMPIERLRRALGLSHPGTVRLVDRLQLHGLVRRENADRDGRAVALHLTATGSQLRKRLLQDRQGALHRALVSLTPAERETLGGLVEKMLRAALRDEAHAYEICRLCNDGVCRKCPVESELGARAATAAR